MITDPKILTVLSLNGISISIFMNNCGCFVRAAKEGEPIIVHDLSQILTSETFDMLIEEILATNEQKKLFHRACNALRDMRIKYVGDLVQKTELELLRGRFFGNVCLKFVKERLDCHGLSLNMCLEGIWERRI